MNAKSREDLIAFSQELVQIFAVYSNIFGSALVENLAERQQSLEEALKSDETIIDTK